ncbi:MAG: glycosyltransferase [Candidatus Helarchaeota archaeon]|nr:glycosyltransferase [Candidatus Helarchaeota archaeon]
MQFVKAERKLGIVSRLITLQKTPYGFEEDICLELPMLKESYFLNFLRKLRNRSKEIRNFKNNALPPVWMPGNIFEKFFFYFRDFIWEFILKNKKISFDLFDFDIYQLDGGLGFLRNGKIIKSFKDKGKKIVCVYFGSDLRRRGLIPIIDSISDINFTAEFDHLMLYKGINFIFAPFNLDKYEVVHNENKKIKICHSPTNFKLKESKRIIDIIKSLENEYPVELVLLTGMKHSEVIKIKSTCDIMIDALGELGYGYNSLESLAMGIPSCTELSPEYEMFIPDHPFINVNENDLKEKIIRLIEDRDFRIKKGLEGRKWLEKYHDGVKVVKSMIEKYKSLGWKLDL